MPIDIVYVTASEFKQQEIAIIQKCCPLGDGRLVGDVFRFELRQLEIRERLETRIEDMVRHEVREAYGQIRVPCIVEHAGLVFDGYDCYPGGLTKPMWNVLHEQFVRKTASANQRATAQAVVAYCDGQRVEAFIGETQGTLVDPPRGGRAFYWDTVFVPDDPAGKANGLTYSEIVDAPALGLEYKVSKLSQSAKAILKFLEWRRGENGRPKLWPEM